MNKAEHEKLQADLDDLRRAVSDLELARAIDPTPEKLEKLQATVEAMAVELNSKVDEMRHALLGNSGPGVVDILTGLTATAEGMGRVLETLHHEGQLKNAVIESLVPKLSLEVMWKEIALMWQNYAVRLSLTHDAA